MKRFITVFICLLAMATNVEAQGLVSTFKHFRIKQNARYATYKSHVPYKGSYVKSNNSLYNGYKVSTYALKKKAEYSNMNDTIKFHLAYDCGYIWGKEYDKDEIIGMYCYDKMNKLDCNIENKDSIYKDAVTHFLNPYYGSYVMNGITQMDDLHQRYESRKKEKMLLDIIGVE